MLRVILCAVLTAVLLVASCGAVGSGPPGLVEKIKHYFNPFGYTLDLGDHIDDFKFTYIVIRSSFRAPDNSKSATFPTDRNYKRRWTRGEQTRLGEKLAKMLGRSLEYSRYGTIMAISWVEHDRPVRISTLRKPFTQSTAEAFEEGYLQDYREKFHYAPLHYAEFDKSELFENSALCPEYDRLWKIVQDSQEREFLARPENQNFLSELRQNILKQPEKVEDEWYPDSLKKVYWLHDILDLEKVTKNSSPRWMTDKTQNKINEFVLEYFKESIYGDDKMAKYLVGPLLNEILNKNRDGYTRLHAHVTDERTFAAFKSMISDAPATPSEFGEMILLDVDINSNVLAINYLPVSNTIMKIPVPFKTLDEFEGKFEDYLLPDENWSAACNGQSYVGERAPATSLSHSPSPRLSSANSGRYESSGTYDTTKSRVPAKWLYSDILNHQYIAPQETARYDSNGPPSSTAPGRNGYDAPTKFNLRWKDDEYMSLEDYLETAKREPIKNTGKDVKGKVYVVRPVIQPYKPWSPKVEHPISYSSEEDDSAKSRNQESTDKGLANPTSTSGVDSVGPRASYDTNRGGLGSVGSTGNLATYNVPRGNSRSYDYPPHQAEKTSYYPSKIVENDLSRFPNQKPEKQTQGEILSSQLQDQSIDFKDGRDYFKDLPRKGDFARGFMDKTSNGVRTEQRSHFRMVDKEEHSEKKEGCFDINGRKIECYESKQADSNRYLTHTAEISHTPLY